MRWRHWWALGGMLLLAGCGLQPTVDGPPDDPGGRSDVSGVPEVIPRAEPKSRYGNPKSYVVFGKRYYTLESSKGFVERGIASWYGKKFHGRRTSSGETYDMYGMTAAHKSLPLPTYVRVTNLENQRSIVLRVNDRGPFVKNRIIDLSYTAAKALGIVRKGTGYVEVRALQPGDTTTAKAPAPAPAPRSGGIRRTPQPSGPQAQTVQLFLQAGAFSVESNALRLKERIQAVVGPITRVQRADVDGLTVYRVRLGPLDGVADADRLSDRLVGMGLEAPRVVLE